MPLDTLLTGITTLSEEAHVMDPQEFRLIECLTEAENYFHSMLVRGREKVLSAARGISGRGFGAASASAGN